MTKPEEAYVATLNLLGSDIREPLLQEIVDREHALADPAFARTLTERGRARQQIWFTSPYFLG